MNDRRELILARLVAIGGDIEQFKTVGRNLLNENDTIRPALSVLDGDENVVEEERRRPPGAPSVVVMEPQLHILAGATAGEVGSDLNVLRRKLMVAIEDDAELKTIMGPNGGAQYLGLATALGYGRDMSGDMVLRYAFKYPLLKRELSA